MVAHGANATRKSPGNDTWKLGRMAIDLCVMLSFLVDRRRISATGQGELSVGFDFV